MGPPSQSQSHPRPWNSFGQGLPASGLNGFLKKCWPLWRPAILMLFHSVSLLTSSDTFTLFRLSDHCVARQHASAETGADGSAGRTRP